MSDETAPQLDQAALEAEFARMEDRYTEGIKGRDMRQTAASIRQFAREMPDSVSSISVLIPPNFDGKRIIFAGSGASLRDCVPQLRQEITTLIASPSNTPYLLRNGVIPDIIACADPLPLMREFLRGFEKELKDVLIVLPVTASPVWRRDPVGKAYYWYLPYLDGPLENKAELPINQVIAGLCPQVDTFILQGGCVTNMAIGLTLSMKRRFKIDQMALIGVDYSEGETEREERIEMRAGLGQNSFIFNMAVKDVYPHEIFPGLATPRSVTYIDMIYAANTVMYSRDLPFELFCTDPRSILSPYLRNADFGQFCSDEGTPVTEPEPDVQNESLKRYLADSTPILLKLENRMKENDTKARLAQYAQVLDAAKSDGAYEALRTQFREEDREAFQAEARGITS